MQPESTIFLLSNDMQFGYIKGIFYHLIDISLSMVTFKCSTLQMQSQPLFSGKKLRLKFC